MRLRLGTRGSALARWQAGEVARQARELGHACEIVVIVTTGDRRTDVPLAAIGGKGLFTQEIEAELRAERIDVAVHSLKDVPSELGAGLALGAVPAREDARDALVAASGMTLATLPAGARVGTSSLRRQAQLLAARPDVAVLPLRGNVDTRLEKWRTGAYDALLLAGAGLKRLGRAAAIAEWIGVEVMCPAAGQGALGLECRAGDTATLAALRGMHDPWSGAAVEAERALVRYLECGCEAPVGAHAVREGAGLVLRAVVAAADGSRVIRAEGRGTDAARLGAETAARLLERGAGELLGVRA